MKPLISYYGGKQRMANKIIPLIPKHTVYVEPFCGGASILFMKPYPDVTNQTNYREIINDTDNQLINMYRVFQTRFDEIKHLLDYTLYSEEEHRKAKNIVRGNVETNDLWMAWAYYYNIQTSFSNVPHGGWKRTTFGRNDSTVLKNNINRLDYFKDRMRYITISSSDALTCIKQWDSPQTFFYIDPPYIANNNVDQGDYKGYTRSDFKNLIETLKTVQGSFLLSCYDNDIVPSDWERFEFKAYCSASCKGMTKNNKSKKATKEELGNRERTEIAWRRFNQVPVRPEIQKLYDSGKFDCFV